LIVADKPVSSLDLAVPVIPKVACSGSSAFGASSRNRFLKLGSALFETGRELEQILASDGTVCPPRIAASSRG
jgi:hypothetical protein